MPSKDRTFSHTDVMRIYNDHLDNKERALLRDFFMFEVFGGPDAYQREVIRATLRIQAEILDAEAVQAARFEPGTGPVRVPGKAISQRLREAMETEGQMFFSPAGRTR